MDNLTPSKAARQIPAPQPAVISRFPLDALELTSPPHLPPRGERHQDAEGSCRLQRRCPPLPPVPPVPSRVLPRHHAITAVSTTATALRRSAESGSPPLDVVVPLGRWPLSSNGSSSTGHVVVPDTPRSTSNIIVTPSVHVASGHHRKALHTKGNLYVDPPTLRPIAASSVISSTSSSAVRLSTAALIHQPSGTNVVESSSSVVITRNASTAIPMIVVTQPPASKAVRNSENTTSVAVVAPGCDKKCKVLCTSGGEPLTCRGGIVCSQCGRCQCANCSAPRELPRRWIGDFECSFQRCVNVTSCLCCVEAIFYHCLDGSGEACVDDCAADDPCACCERPRCCVRWTVMTLLATTFLPCLCCYCPMQCASEGISSCYNSCKKARGCRCRRQGSQEASSSGGSIRGLLAESSESSGT